MSKVQNHYPNIFENITHLSKWAHQEKRFKWLYKSLGTTTLSTIWIKAWFHLHMHSFKAAYRCTNLPFPRGHACDCYDCPCKWHHNFTLALISPSSSNDTPPYFLVGLVLCCCPTAPPLVYSRKAVIWIWGGEGEAHSQGGDPLITWEID
jgi:hypothetical protein